MNPLDAIGVGVAVLSVFGVWGATRTIGRPQAPGFSRRLVGVLAVACLLTMILLFLPWAVRVGELGSLGGVTAAVFALMLVVAAYWSVNQEEDAESEPHQPQPARRKGSAKP